MSGALNPFRGLIQGLVQQAIQIVGDLADTVTYSSNVQGSYDPAAGVASNVTTVYNFNGVISRMSETDEAETSNRSSGRVDAKVVLSRDAIMTCAYLDLPVTPTTNDTMSSVNGSTGIVTYWRVIKATGVPGNSAWKIQIRET